MRKLNAAAAVFSIACVFLTGCNSEGGTANESASGIDPESRTTAAAVAGSPVISGEATATLVAGTTYQFQPVASDPNGDRLTFSISGRPAWAAFDTVSGTLSGTPNASQVGNYTNVVITVSDGTGATSLAPFTINVVATGAGGGAATLVWSPPTQNTNGSSITNLGGYKIYYGTSATAMTQVIDIANPGITSRVVDNLVSGTWFFAMSAYNAAGIESAMKVVGSKTIL